MKSLPQQFTKNGFTYNQVIRGHKKAIYSQYHGNILIGYEVIKIRVHPPKYNSFLSREDPAMELYPRSEQWGKYGWTYRTLEQAMVKYKTLENK